MSLRMPITKAKIKNHFQYHFWKYLLLGVLALVFWNLLFSVTRYRTPPEKKVEFFVEGALPLGGEDALDELMQTIRTQAMPEMEEVAYAFLTLDETYGAMQLSVWVGAGEGDVYALGQERFQYMAQGGAMVNLQPYVDSGRLSVAGIDLGPGMAVLESTGEKALYGIPMDTLTGLTPYGIRTEGCLMSLLVSGGNQEYALRLMEYLLTHMGEVPAP